MIIAMKKMKIQMEKNKAKLMGKRMQSCKKWMKI